MITIIRHGWKRERGRTPSGTTTRQTSTSKLTVIMRRKILPSKLQLGTFLRQSLVTHCAMTPTEAVTVLDEAFDRTMDLN
jgi:hypothetical protein